MSRRRTAEGPGGRVGLLGWAVRFVALSRLPRVALDIATPAMAALLWLGHLAPARTVVIGLVTAFAGYTSVHALDDQAWMTAFQTNFMSAVRVIRSVLPSMRSRGSGVILSNASDLARQPEPHLIDYQVSKVGLVSLTKALAAAEGPRIRVNAVAPGPIWTPLWTRPGGVAETLAQFHHLPPREAVEHEMKRRQMPMGRMGEPQEVAGVFVLLASDQASFVTGSIWGVDGGTIRGLF